MDDRRDRSGRPRRWAAVGIVLALGPVAPAGAQPCPPRAALDGDAAAVVRVGAELQRLGVAVDHGPAPRGCRAVLAAVELDRSGGIAVSVSDATHRSEGRVVSDAALAAAWIDSWLRDDFEAAALPPEQPPAAPAPQAAAAVPARGVFDRVSIAASYDQLWSDDSTSWTGIGGAACVRVGATCLGARFRYASQDVNEMFTTAARSDLSLLATASWNVELGRMTVSPELGVGVGRMTTDRVESCPEPVMQNCDPMTDPMCPAPSPTCTGQNPGIYVGDSFHAATITPRLAAALRIAVPLFERVWLDGIASVGYAPFGHDTPYVGAPPPPDANGTEPYMPAEVAMPGEPVFGVTLGLGIRVGAP